MAELSKREFYAVPETVNLHVWPKCNLACRYCYGSFPDRPPTLPARDWCRIIDMLAAERVRRVTLSGGEPTLHPELETMVRHARACGLQTSIVTNGVRLTDALISQLDLVGLSLDSANETTQAALGRRLPAGRSYVEHIRGVAVRVHENGARFKLNTVVTRLNLAEDLSAVVLDLRPSKWKPMQFVYVRGENDASAADLAVTGSEFDQFVERHSRVADAAIWYEPESADTIRSTYVMVGPAGRLFQHGPDGHQRSAPLLQVGLVRALAQVGGYDRAEFERRGGHVDVRRLAIMQGDL